MNRAESENLFKVSGIVRSELRSGAERSILRKAGEGRSVERSILQGASSGAERSILHKIPEQSEFRSAPAFFTIFGYPKFFGRKVRQKIFRPKIFFTGKIFFDTNIFFTTQKSKIEPERSEFLGPERTPRSGAGAERTPRPGAGAERTPGSGAGAERTPRSGAGAERTPMHR